MPSTSPSPKRKTADGSVALFAAGSKNTNGETGIENQVTQTQETKPQTVTRAVTPERFIESLSRSDVKPSESSLSEGFSWQPRQPVRPGQFSERPQRHLQNNHPSELEKFQSTKVLISDGLPNGNSRAKPQLKEPLQLPELAFYNTKEDNHQANGSNANSTSIALQNTMPAICEISHPGPYMKQEDNGCSTSFPFPSQANTTHGSGIGIGAPYLLSSPDQQKPKERKDSASTCSHASIGYNSERLSRDHGALTGKEASASASAKPSVFESPPTLNHFTKHHHRQPSHSSRCGDLEPPRYQSPRCQRRAPSAGSRDSARRRSRSKRHSEKPNENQGRSHSRTSNISRKRSAVSKSQTRRDSDRKQTAMHQLAQYWNQCLQIAAEEKEDANEEIERLHVEIKDRSKRLEEAQLLLSRKEVQINELESQNVELKELDSTACNQNIKLTEEVDELRKELSDSNTKLSHLGEKCKTFKKKVNEVLTEQQSLYGQTESSFKTAIMELQQEKEKRESQAKEIDSAVNLSEQKREQMKRAFDDIHTRDQNEIQQNKETISILRSEVSAQREQTVARENALHENIQKQSEIYYQNGQQKLEDIEAKVDLVLEACKQTLQKEEEHSAPIASISKKMDLVMENIEAASDQRPQQLLEVTRSAIEPVSQDLEDRIISRLLPVILEGFSKYDKLEETVSNIGSAFQSDLANIKQAIFWELQGRIEQSSNTNQCHDTMIDSLKTLREEISDTKKLCEGTRSAQNELTKTIDNAVVSTSESEKLRLEKKIEEKDLKINDLWVQVVSLKHEYSANLEAANAREATQEPSKIQQLLQENSHHITQNLQQAFDRDRQVITETICQNEEANKSFRSQIQEAVARIIDSRVQDTPDVRKLEEQLREERASVVSLTHKIGSLEQEAQKAEMLQGQWQQDFKTVAVLRAKLEATAQRLPKVEALATKLNGIARLNDVIHSTTTFLGVESQWIEAELSGRGKLQESNPDKQQNLENVAPPTFRQPTLELNGVPMSSGFVPATQHTELLVKEDIYADDAIRRKVMVHSPTGESESPSPPPSVGQEQRRRREGVRPRSILRSSTKLLEKTQASRGHELLGHPMHHSQYNRPVVAVTGTGAESGNNVDSEIINRFQSTLVPQRHYQQHWEFPTVAEFEESIRLGNQKRQHESPVDSNEDRATKRTKENTPIVPLGLELSQAATVPPQN